MATHGSEENGLTWSDGHNDYHQLFTVVSEAAAGFAQLYSYGFTKSKFLAELQGLPILNLQDFNCPQPATSNHKRWWSLPCHKSHNINCATKTAHSLFNWFLYHLQIKSYVKSPKDMTRHSAKFVSAT